jgi:CDP-glucose 4,6-dehydratase
MVDNNFWKDKKVFITGHTGFKGSWLTIWLKELGANIKGYSLAPIYKENLFDSSKIGNEINSEINDIRDLEKLKKSIKVFQPEIIFHLAAQPLVRYSYEHPIETYQVNVMGTLNLLETIRETESVKSVIIVTTDKCYENKESDYYYEETDPMGGYDPYSSSKGCCELLISSYRRSYFNSTNTLISSVRAGNVIGGGDWSTDRLIPDLIKSTTTNKKILIRNPNAIRPWQHVLEPLYGYLNLAKKLYYGNSDYAEGWNFGPEKKDCKSVEWISNKMTNMWKEIKWEKDNEVNPHEAKLLMLSIKKAKEKLNWHPKWDLEHSLESIVNWHKQYAMKKCAKELCLDDIKKYSL